jgi:hypothetical protein
MTKDELIHILWSELRRHNEPEALEGYFDYLFEDQEVADLADIVTAAVNLRLEGLPDYRPIHNNDSGFEAAVEDEAVEETCFRLIIECPTFDTMEPREREKFLLQIAMYCIAWTMDRENF